MAVNTITGTTGNDLLQGQQLSGTQNQINGLAGNDTLLAATISDSLNGGAGNDSLSYGTGLTINGAVAVGGNGNDSFFAVGTTLLASSFSGESGNDLFSFTAATNIASASVRGGEGADTVTFVAGGATLNGLVATMGQGADLLNFTGSTFVNGAVYGGQDNDTIQLANSINATTIGGNEGADRIQIATATLLNSVIGAGKGHDIVTTTALAGALVGTIGSIVGGEGLDSINISFGAASTNTSLTVFGDVSEGGDSTLGAADFINFSANGLTELGSSSVYGGVGNDTITFGGITAGRATAIAIRAFGNDGTDSITFGAGGASSLNGGAGNDTLIGQFTFTAGGINSGFNLNGGTGIDRLLYANTNTGALLTGGFTGATILGSVVGGFADSGDNLILQGIGGNTANFSGVNFIATGTQALAAQALGGTASTFTGAFVYNITGGLSSIAVSGLKLGDMNIYEANGDTVIQILNTTQYTAATAFGIGDTIGSAVSAGTFAAGDNQLIQFTLSGNLGVIDNGTAGFIGKTGVNFTFGIANDSTLGRNGFTITVV